MKYRIMGDNLQMALVELAQNEKVYAEAGAMNHMSGNMVMEARARGGLMSGLKRKLMNETFFVTEFYPSGGSGYVAFRGNVPGKIMPVEIAPGKEFIVQKDAFLAAEDSVNLEITFQRRLGSGFFGGEGFILEKLTGQGTAFINAAGDFVEYVLQPGQQVKVSTGCVVGFEPTVHFDIQTVGGLKTMFFGGEGVFVTILTGPGRIVLQSMTIGNLAMAIYPFLPRTNQ